MTRRQATASLALLTFAITLLAGFGHNDHAFWSQWGCDAQHTVSFPVDVQLDGQAVFTANVLLVASG